MLSLRTSTPIFTSWKSSRTISKFIWDSCSKIIDIRQVLLSFCELYNKRGVVKVPLLGMCASPVIFPLGRVKNVHSRAGR